MFIFKEVFKETIWGGDRIAAMKEKFHLCHDVGESWELSGIEGRETLVVEGRDKGKSLKELSEEYGRLFLGNHVYDRYGTDFPLLIKFIDAHEDLSIQVHPDDVVAKRRHGCNGKAEMWYVVDATPEARLLVGFDHDMTSNEYDEAVCNGEIADNIRSHSVKKGDVFFLPPGRVHAACKGVLLAEIQQSSDITYRIYDYGRRDKDGKTRELHTKEAREVLDFTSDNDYRTHYKYKVNEPTGLVSCEYFATDLLTVDRSVHLDVSAYDSFCILICVEGEVAICQSEGVNPGKETLKKGHTVLLPADAGKVTITPSTSSKLLLVRVP